MRLNVPVARAAAPGASMLHAARAKSDPRLCTARAANVALVMLLHKAGADTAHQYTCRASPRS